jgi:glycosyltransferase involved in cell wall biosynthesis
MQVGFEAKRFFSNFTGLGNYARFVVDALSTYAPEHDYTLYTPKVRQHPEIDPITSRDNVHVVSPSGGYRYMKSLWRSRGMSSHPSVDNLNVFHGLSQELPTGLPDHIKKIVTVHDLIYIRYPQFYNPVDVAIYKAKAKAACSKADVVVAISQQTADDLVEFLQVDRQKIKVVYQGCHPIFKQQKSQAEKQSVTIKYNLPKEYILTVGTIEERKNAKLLIQALSRLPDDLRIPLVLVGRATKYTEEVIQLAQELDVYDNLIFLHNASFTDFPAIYQQASVFVYPSLFEGFGIPLVEAIESGVPVITSTGSCFSEAAGRGAVYVNPEDDAELAHELATLLSDTTLRKQMVDTARIHIQQFQPKVIAGHLLAVYGQ